MYKAQAISSRVGTVLVGFAIVLSTGQLRASDSIIKPSTRSFSSGGKRITAEQFSPNEKGPRPAIVMLHGIGGLESSGKTYRTAAKLLADKGYLVLLVHYHERTGTKPEEVPALLKQFQALLSGKGNNNACQKSVV